MFVLYVFFCRAKRINVAYHPNMEGEEALYVVGGEINVLCSEGEGSAGVGCSVGSEGKI